MKNLSSSGTSVLMSQSDGLKIELINNVLKYTLGGQSISSTILKDGNFNHYTLSYNASIPKLSIIENDKELAATTIPNPITTLNFTNSNPLIIGGSTFIGNIHDLRIWAKAITRDQSVANMNVSLSGSESGIVGFWPMNEGNGTIAKDLARFKSLDIVNSNWDIFPKGTAYNFSGGNYLATNSNTFSKVIISKEMDATVTFWMKTAQSNATIMSNGKGDSTDIVESNQYRNKWAFNTNANGGLELAAEGKTYSFGNIKVNDNSWHHYVYLIDTDNPKVNNIKVYQDGVLLATRLAEYDLTLKVNTKEGSPLKIGKCSAPNDPSFFKGAIDEIRIYSRALSASEIKYLATH
jgi:hypothetical protein